MLIGERLVHALLQSPGCNFTSSAGCHFPQQIDPFTAVPYPGDCYGPMILSLSEHVDMKLMVQTVYQTVSAFLALRPKQNACRMTVRIQYP